jgi:hypothetical protein
MVNPMRVSFLLLLTVSIAFAALIPGCSRKPATEPAGKEAKDRAKPDAGASGPSTVSPEQRKDLEDLAKEVDRKSGTDIGTKAVGAAISKHAVTDDEVKALTTFGPFYFPNSTLVTKESFSQKFGEGTEIYKLEFGVSVPQETVVQWYKEHLESGVRITPGKMGDGSAYTNFDYTPSDGSWIKTITIKGYQSQASCTISVNLVNKGKAPEEAKKDKKTVKK